MYIIEEEENRELTQYIKEKYTVTSVDKAHVIIVGNVKNTSRAIKIVDCALDMGKDIICVKSNVYNKNFVTFVLIKDGATWV